MIGKKIVVFGVIGTLGICAGIFAGVTIGKQQAESVTVASVNTTPSGENTDIERETCQQIIDGYLEGSKFIENKEENIAGETVLCYVFSEGKNKYYVSPFFGQIVKIEYGDSYESKDIENIVKDVMKPGYDISRKIDNRDYVHVIEKDGEYETGSYALFTIGQDGKIMNAYFYHNTDYKEIQSKMIDEQEAVSAAKKAIAEKYNGSYGLNIVLKDRCDVKRASLFAKQVYEVTASGTGDDGNEIVFVVKIDAVSGEVIEVASSLTY